MQNLEFCGELERLVTTADHDWYHGGPTGEVEVAHIGDYDGVSAGGWHLMRDGESVGGGPFESYAAARRRMRELKLVDVHDSDAYREAVTEAARFRESGDL